MTDCTKFHHSSTFSRGSVILRVKLRILSQTPLANIVFANIFGKFIFPRTYGEPGENDEPTVPAITWKLLVRSKNLSVNMAENKNSDKHGTQWAANILCVRRKNRQKMVHNELFELFANPLLFTQTSCSQIDLQTKCWQVNTQLKTSSYTLIGFTHLEERGAFKFLCKLGKIFHRKPGNDASSVWWARFILYYYPHEVLAFQRWLWIIEWWWEGWKTSGTAFNSEHRSCSFPPHTGCPSNKTRKPFKKHSLDNCL